MSFPAQVRMRTGIIEYALVHQQGKTHESLLSTETEPTHAHLAFLLLGVEPMEVGGGLNQPMPAEKTNAVQITVTWTEGSTNVSRPLSDLIALSTNASARPAIFPVVHWIYNGSVFNQRGFAAQQEGSLISLIRDPSALVNNPGPDRDNDQVHLPRTEVIPPSETPVIVTFQLSPLAGAQ